MRAVSRHRAEREPVAAADVATGVLEIVTSVPRPVVLGIDDAQWMDPASARIVAFLLRELEQGGAGLVATTRAASMPALVVGLRHERVVTLEVGPLSEAELDDLIRRRLGAALRRPTLARIHAFSGGNPLYGLELARAALSGGRGAGPDGLALPPTLDELIGHRLRAAASAADALFLVAAAPALTADAVRAVLGNPGKAAVEHAVDLRLLEVDAGRLRFTHPLLAAAAYDALAPSRRRRLHARLAELASNAEERGRHLAAAIVLPDAEVAAALDEAVRAAAGRDSPESAAALAARAADLTPVDDAAAWRRRSIAAADHGWTAGDDLAVLARLEDLLARSAPGRERAEVLYRLAVFDAGRRSFVSCRERLTAALDDAAVVHTDGVHDISALLARLHSVEAFARLQSGDVVGAGEPARAAVRSARASGDADLLDDAEVILLHHLTITGAPGPVTPEALETLRRCARQETGNVWFPGGSRRVFAAAVMKWTDQVGEARGVLTDVLWRRWHQQQDGLMLAALFQLGELEVWAGHYQEADRLGGMLLDHERRNGGATAHVMRLYLTAATAARRGAVETALAASGEMLRSAEHGGDARNVLRALSVRGLTELGAGRAGEAAVTLKQLVGEQRRLGYRHPGVLRSDGDYVETLLETGDVQGAALHLDDFAARVEATGSPWGRACVLRCRGLLALALQDKDAAVSWLAASAEVEQPDPLERGRTLLALGAVLRRVRRRVDAQNVLRSAVDVLLGLGAEAWHGRAVEELRRAGGDDGRGPVRAAREELGLTDGQHAVAALVAAGHSNKEVAARLYMSPKTVEAHLSSIYRRLDVRSRTELAVRWHAAPVARRDSPDA